MIFESDIGHDPDDFWTLCWFIENNIKIHGITIHPGYKDQVAFVKFVLKECGLDIPVGTLGKESEKPGIQGQHGTFLHKYHYPMREEADCNSVDLIKQFKDEDLFIIGPFTNVAKYIDTYPEGTFNKVFVQGGYISYEEMEKNGIIADIKKEHFVGYPKQPSTNVCGASKYVEPLKARSNDISFITKSLCHTVRINRDIFTQYFDEKPKNRGGELLREALDMYLGYGKQDKAMHDVVAAHFLIRPQYYKFLKGAMYCSGGKCWFDTSTDGKNNVAVAMDREQYWNDLSKGF